MKNMLDFHLKNTYTSNTVHLYMYYLGNQSSRAFLVSSGCFVVFFTHPRRFEILCTCVSTPIPDEIKPTGSFLVHCYCYHLIVQDCPNTCASCNNYPDKTSVVMNKLHLNFILQNNTTNS